VGIEIGKMSHSQYKIKREGKSATGRVTFPFSKKKYFILREKDE